MASYSNYTAVSKPPFRKHFRCGGMPGVGFRNPSVIRPVKLSTMIDLPQTMLHISELAFLLANVTSSAVGRLGRILRKKDGKRATLYELVSARTTEANTSERRRDHGAYR